MADAYKLKIEQGATCTVSVTVTALNLTGYTARMQGRTSHAASTTVFSLTSPSGGLSISPGTNSIITITIPASSTAAMAAPSFGVYDLEIESGSGVVTRLIEGEYQITPEVTR
jgi:hypothetical protein